MNTTSSIKTFSDLIIKNRIQANNDIQRGFEWKASDVTRYHDHIIEDMKLKSEILDDRGTMSLIKMEEKAFNGHEMVNIQNNLDSCHRYIINILYTVSINNIIKNNNIDTEGIDVFTLSKMINAIKIGNYETVPNDKNVFNYIIGNSDNIIEIEKKSKLYIAFTILNDKLTELAGKEPKIFKDFVNYICNDISFIVVEYTNCSEQAARRKYEEINADRCDQSEMHRAISNIRDVAVTFSTDTLKIFNNNYTLAIKQLKDAWPNKKNSEIETLMCTYIASNVLANFGGKRESDTKLDKIVQNTIKNNQTKELNDKVQNFIEKMFDKIGLFINLKKRKISYKMNSSVTSINYDFSAISYITSTSKIRLHLLATIFKIFDCYITDSGGNIIGYADENSINNIYADKFVSELVRFYFFDKAGFSYDCRGKLHTLIKDGKKIDAKEYYESLFKTNNEWYHTSRFLNDKLFNLKKDPKYLVLSLIEAMNKSYTNNNEYYILAKNYLDNKELYDIDHILTKGYCKEHNIPNEDRDCIGNIRLLQLNKNRSENHGKNQKRNIEENDTTFYEEVRGREFLETDIEPNLDYKVNMFKNSVFFEQYNNCI